MRWILLLLLGQDAVEEIPRPVLTDDRLIVELVASEPDIVTPPALDVDERGRIWALENNTHHRQADYKGPPTDRIRIFEDFGANGRARKVTTFAEGFHLGTSLLLGKNGAVFVTTRSQVFRVDGGTPRLIVDMKTEAVYPHNGLAGLALGPAGFLYFTLGENFGKPYEFVGSDGKRVRGGGEGGSLYRCRPDGSGLERLATGVWNCFDLAFDRFGVPLAGDDDPGHRPPCRLLHVVEGANYGFQSRHHRNGLSVLSSWTGEGPGTLSMIAPVPQSPSGVLVYESDGLPEDYRGDVIVTSWADHLIKRFRLAPDGASFKAAGEPKLMAHGDANFRPVAIKIAPDGSLVISDWASRSYPVHGAGRIWRIRWRGHQAPPRPNPADLSSEELGKLLGHPHRRLRRAAADALAARKDGRRVLGEVLRADARPVARIEALWAEFRGDAPGAFGIVPLAAGDKSWRIRGEAVRLAAPTPELLLPALDDASPFVRMHAILGLKERLPLERLAELLKSDDPFLRSAAVTAAGRPSMIEPLRKLAKDENDLVRLGAALALQRANDPEARRMVPSFLKDPDARIRRTAMQWIAEDRLREYIPDMEEALAGSDIPQLLIDVYFEVLKLLKDDSILKEASGRDAREAIRAVFEDEAKPGALRASALRMLNPAPGTERLRPLLSHPEEALRREALRSIALGPDRRGADVLRAVAADPKFSRALRAEAVLGLADTSGASEETRRLLFNLLGDDQGELRAEAVHALRPAVGNAAVRDVLLTSNWLGEPVWMALRFDAEARSDPRFIPLMRFEKERPKSTAEWKPILSQPGDAEAGERVFFNPNGPKCYVCHRVGGRGGALGPDLTRIAQDRNFDKLIESILEPDKEIAPQFEGWIFALRNGDVVTARIHEETGDLFRVMTLEKRTTLRKSNILAHQRYRSSMMPRSLESALTKKQFRDLIAFLSARRR